jgi:hypothetical protein
MHNIRRRLSGTSVLAKTQRSRAMLFRTRFTTIWWNKIRISPKVEAGAGFFSGVQYIVSVKDIEDIMLEIALAPTTYGMWRMKSTTQATATDNTYYVLTEPDLTSRDIIIIIIYYLHKTAVLWTSHIIRDVLQSKTWSLCSGVHHWFKRRCTIGNMW